MPRLRSNRQRKSVEHVDVPTAKMVVVTDLSGDETFPVKDAFVKLAPRMTRAELERHDLARLKQVCLDAGAIVVVVAPEVLPDVTVRRTEREAVSLGAYELVRAWLGEAVVGEYERGLVYAYLEKVMGEVGL